MRDWVSSVEDTHYLLGTVTGPAPFPEMVRHFHEVIGTEAREQVLARAGRLPDAVAACVGGGSNAIGLFSAFIADPGVRLRGYEAGGLGIDSGKHAARFSGGRPGVLHGARTYVLQDEFGQTAEPLGLRGPGLSRASGPSTPTCTTSDAAAYRAGRGRRGHGGVRPAVAAPRASSRRSRAPTRSPARCGWAASSARTR